MRSTRDTNHFTLLHEGARHAIHSSETLSVAVGTLSSIQQYIMSQSKWPSAISWDMQDEVESINRQLDFQVRMLQNLHLRAKSNKERLQNEIALVIYAHFLP
jgi:hypothetical protein